MLLPKKFYPYLYELFTSNRKISMSCVDGTVKTITLDDICVISHEPNDSCHLITVGSEHKYDPVMERRVIDLMKSILAYRSEYSDCIDMNIVLTSQMPHDPCSPKSLYTLNLEIYLNGKPTEKWHLSSPGSINVSEYNFKSLLDHTDGNVSSCKHSKMLDERGHKLAQAWSKLHTLQYNHCVYAERHLTSITNIVYRLLFTNEWVDITYDFAFGSIVNVSTFQMDSVNLQAMLPNDFTKPLEFPAMYRYVQYTIRQILRSNIEKTTDIIKGTTQKRYTIGRSALETKILSNDNN